MVSTRQQGNIIENRFANELRKLGYFVIIGRGSRGLDILAIHQEPESNWPHIAAEIGTRLKPIGASLKELLQHRLPAGTIRVVARYCRKKGTRPHWKYHTANGTFLDFTNLVRFEREH